MKKTVAVVGIIFFSSTIIGLIFQGGIVARISPAPLVVIVLLCLLALMFFREALLPRWPEKDKNQEPGME